MNVKTTTPTNPVRDALRDARKAETAAWDAWVAYDPAASPQAQARCAASWAAIDVAVDRTAAAQAAYDTGRAAAMTALMADLFGPAAA